MKPRSVRSITQQLLQELLLAFLLLLGLPTLCWLILGGTSPKIPQVELPRIP